MPIIPDAPAARQEIQLVEQMSGQTSEKIDSKNNPKRKTVHFMKENEISNLRFSEKVLSNIGKMAPVVTMGIIPVPCMRSGPLRCKISISKMIVVMEGGGEGSELPPVHPLDGTNKDNNGGLGSGSSGSGIPITVTGGVMEDEDVGFPLDDPTVVQDPRNEICTKLKAE